MRTFTTFTTNIIIFIIMLSISTDARSFRVKQIPNGSTYSCSNCHVSAGGGGKLTPFGVDVKNSLNGMDVNWNEKLAKLDSDGDGYTNGEELFDPDGKWRPGNIDPGNSSDVGNPGDTRSTPVITDIEESSQFAISISPNPVTNSAEITVIWDKSSYVNIELIDINGMIIHQLYTGYVEPGSLYLNWNRTDNNGDSVSKGIYFFRITYNSKIIVRPVIVI